MRLPSSDLIRFRVEHLEEGFAALKPSEQFVGTKMQQIYRLYPLPFGTQRASLQKCLTKWGWAARVRQSVGGGDEGTAWEVGAQLRPSIIHSSVARYGRCDHHTAKIHDQASGTSSLVATPKNF